MTEVLTYEALKAERDALQKRADALAVENAALKSKAAELVHEASEVYSAYNATIREPDGDFMDMQTLYEMQRIETPATDAALAAIQAQGVEKFADFLGELYQCEKANTAKGKAYKHVVFLACRFVNELREAK